MLPESFFHDLQDVFSEMDCQTILTALRQDPLVWDSIQKEEFFHAAKKAAAMDIHAWCPANLALAWLQVAETLADLRSYPLIPLEAEMRQQVANVYEEFVKAGQPSASLGDAGMVALALRERRRLTDSWKGLRAEMQAVTRAEGSSLFEIWRSSIACLFGFATDPIEFLQELAPENVTGELSFGIDLIVHALLSNPLSLSEQANFLVRVINAYSNDEQMIWMKRLEESCRAELVAQVAAHLLHKEENNAKALFNGESASRYDLLSEMPQYRLGAFYQYAGSPSMSIPLMIETQQALRRIQAHVAHQIANAAEANGDFTQAIPSRKEVVALENEAPAACVELADTLLASGDVEGAQAVIPCEENSTIVTLAKAKVALASGDVSQAQDHAKQVLSAERRGRKLRASVLDERSTVSLAKTLLAAGLTDEAIQASKALAAARPNDAEVIHLLAQAHLAGANYDQAIESASLAVCLQPENLQIRRSLAESFASAGQWDQALAVRKDIETRSEEVSVPDLVALAQCALHAGDAVEASRAAQAALALDTENGPAYAVLAEAEAAQGDTSGAQEHYTQGTLADPEDASCWIGLSNLQKASGQEAQALTTLREAVLAAPQTAALHYALGEELIADGSPSEALGSLRRAADIDVKSAVYALRLTSVLTDLGHLPEAKQILERTRQYWPYHPELAFAHGKVLLEMGETTSAVQPLRVKLNAQPAEIDPYLLYARALASVPQDQPSGASARADSKTIIGLNPLADARLALEKALAIDPTSLEARVLLAENLLAAGLLPEAGDLFLSLSESLSPENQSWNGRIKLGMGKTALALGETDAAVAALQEAAAEMPNHLNAQQALAEAYFTSGLKQEAYQTGQDALRLYPTDVQNLVWYSGLAYMLGVYPDCIATLDRAAEISPRPAEIFLKIAQVHQRTENVSSMKSVLEAIMESSQVSPAEYQQTAHAWLSLGDTEQAISCMKKAIEKEANPDLAFELAQILDLNDQPEDALHVLRESLSTLPDQRRVFVAEAQILGKTGRVKEAMEALEMALRLPDNPVVSAPPVAAKRAGIPAVQKPAYPAIPADSAHIHLQIAATLRKMGEIPNALEHAVRAVELDPINPEIAAFASDLAYCTLDIEKSVELTEQAVSAVIQRLSEVNQEVETAYSQPEQATLLLCASAELAIEMDQIEKAQSLASAAHALNPTHPRVFALQARLATLGGDYLLGEQLYESAINRLTQLTTPEQRFDTTEKRETAKNLALSAFAQEYPTISLAQTALDLHHWDEAIQLFAQAAKNTPDEPRSHLFLARALVLSAESQRLFNNVHIVSHLPGDDKLSDANAQLFEKALQAASKISSASIIARWRTRGFAAFHPDPRCAELFNQLQPTAEDAAAQAAVSLECNQPAQAKEMVKPYSSHPKALIQLALASQNDNPAEGFFAARSLAGAQPSNPVAQAALALLADQVDEYDIARDAIEKALEIWPNEPEWHAFAADLNRHTGEFERSLQHQMKAYELNPTDTRYAMSLGKSYLRSGKTSDAIRLFDEVARIDPNNVNAWLALAKANEIAGDLPAAIACTEKAISIAPNTLEPVLLCGNIALKAGQVELARQRANYAKSIDPTEAQAHLLLVRSYEAQGQAEEALKTVESAVEQVRDPYALQLERVALVRKLRGPEAGLQLLQTLAATYSDEPAVLTLLAEALVETGQRDAAEHAAKSALQLQPDQPSLHLMVGRLQRNSGQLDQAVHHITEAIRLAPQRNRGLSGAWPGLSRSTRIH
ncbi:MAG TPA: tetratricopeptide repeat protein, partial [Anaerolineaceae bacterium]|nr:tetratricopeptide repeat protein [Anaerolineaceae bacterium]